MMQKLLLCAGIIAVIAPLQGCAPIAVGAAAAGGLVMVDDRRTTGIYIEDENIEWKALSAIRNASSVAHVNTTSYNRKVLLTGEAPTDADKKKIEEAVAGVASVREVTNEIQVAGNSSLAARGSDGLVTSNVKVRMVNNGKFSPNHVKVLTEGGVVYLMGLVTQYEGDAAAEIARTTSGVSRVVKVFEYTGTGK
jgi:osmotically-inducible protein OsmY